MRKIIVVLSVFLVFAACGSHNNSDSEINNESDVKTANSLETSIMLTREKIEALEFEQVVINDENELAVVIEGEEFLVENVVNVDATSRDDYLFYYLQTDMPDIQLLFSISQADEQMTVHEYYPDTSFFMAEELLLLSIQPYDLPTLEQTITVTDVETGEEKLERALSFERSMGDIRLQELRYQKVVSIHMHGIGYGIEILWEQAHYPMRKAFYSIDENVVRLSSNDGDYAINELQAVNFSIEEYGNDILVIPNDAEIIAGTSNDDNSLISILLSDNGNTTDYNTIELVSIDTATSEILKRTSFADVFLYQDPFVGAVGAGWKESNAAYIIETKEFEYDFYWNPETGDHDIYLRPSSFTTRYVK